MFGSVYEERGQLLSERSDETDTAELRKGREGSRKIYKI